MRTPEQAEQIVRAARDSGLTPDAEITMECNPRPGMSGYFQKLKHIGVNRISLGMQSAVPEERAALGRQVPPKLVIRAVQEAKQAGIANISVDLMLGTPGMTRRSLQESLDAILRLDVPHVSAYLLKIEPGTPFYERREQLELPEEDAVCDMYLDMVRCLEEAGLRQYEISNFARPGFESRHNLKYWLCTEYLGGGPAAHCYLVGKRSYMPRDLDAFLSGGAIIPDGAGGGRAEQILLGLRLAQGIPAKWLDETALTNARNYARRGLVRLEHGRVSLTPDGFLLSNTLIARLLPDEEASAL
ncbi:MAG: coproporphyrinogen III oxidase family protein [Clostridiales bacterium]|nr:coproporphyrinogen III oxidase family protein [Clostridiales bacterium]